jgi:DNA-binding NarL/FixJ family response regulator
LTKILIVEDHALVREAMAQTLMSMGPATECVEAGSGDEALAYLEVHHDCDLAIVDLMLPGMDGFALLGVLAKRYPDVPVLVVSALDDTDSVRRAQRAGASGFVVKSSSTERLIEAVRTVLNGGVVTPDSVTQTRTRSQASPADRYGLTQGQMRVLELLKEGRTNKEIADLLGLSEGTVKVHMSAIFRALNVKNRTQALLKIAGKAGRPVGRAVPLPRKPEEKRVDDKGAGDKIADDQQIEDAASPDR